METRKHDPESNGPILLPVGQVARLLGISSRTVWRRLSAGEMVEPVRIGASVRWRRRDIDEWVDQGCPVNPPSAEEVR